MYLSLALLVKRIAAVADIQDFIELYSFQKYFFHTLSARRCIYFEVQVLFFAPSCPVADTLPQEVQYKVEVLT